MFTYLLHFSELLVVYIIITVTTQTKSANESELWGLEYHEKLTSMISTKLVDI